MADMTRQELFDLINTESPAYSVPEWFSSLPKELVQGERQRAKTSKELRAYSSTAKNRIHRRTERLKKIFDEDFKDKNSRDYYKYLHPETKVRAAKPIDNVTLGYVDRRAPKIAEIVKPDLGTILHEATHVDTNLHPKQAYFLGSKTSPLNSMYLHLNSLPKDLKDKYVRGSNIGVSPDEGRANLRAAFGEQPYGTTSEEFFNALLDELYKRQDTYKYDNQAYAKEHSREPRAIPRSGALRALEMDLFPRERWIEPRPPTFKEAWGDKLTEAKQGLQNLFKRK